MTHRITCIPAGCWLDSFDTDACRDDRLQYIVVVIHLLLIIGTNGQMMVSSNSIQTGKYPRMHLTVVAEVDDVN